MVTSTVKFRISSGTEWVQVSFNGSSIVLLELKRHIVQKKWPTATSEFDVAVVDTNGNEYKADDEEVPRDSALIIRRIPSMRKNMGLLARLKIPKGRGHTGISIHNRPTEINLPMQEEEEFVPIAHTIPPPPMPPASSVASADTTDDKKDIETNETVDDDEDVTAGLEALQAQGLANAGPGMIGKGLGPGGRGNGRFTMSNRGFNHLACQRCGEMGHKDRYCPTIGDPNYDPVEYQRLSNVPKALRTTVDSIEGLDLTNKTVISNEDGTYDIVNAPTDGLKSIQIDGAVFKETEINMDNVPDALKCPITNKLLKYAVELPCCHKCVDDNEIRKMLLNSTNMSTDENGSDSNSMKCPLCSSTNITLEGLIMRNDIRKSVDNYVSRLATDADAAMEPAKTEEELQAENLKEMLNPENWGGYGANGAATMGVGGMPSMPTGGHSMQMMGAAGYGGSMGYDPWNPPKEMLPPPMSRDDFLYEQAMQRQEDERRRNRKTRDNRNDSRRNNGRDERRRSRSRSPESRRRRNDRDSRDNNRSSRNRNARDSKRNRSRSRDRDSSGESESESYHHHGDRKERGGNNRKRGGGGGSNNNRRGGRRGRGGGN
jgi:hypothetical protein